MAIDHANSTFVKSSRDKSQLLAASDVLQSLLQNSKSPLSQQFIRWRLWKYWADVVGTDVAKHTDPVGYEKGCLYVWVSNSTRLHELTYVVKPLRQKINEYIGKKWVRSIRFTLDRKAVPKLAEMSEGSRDFLSKRPPSGGEGPQRGR